MTRKALLVGVLAIGLGVTPAMAQRGGEQPLPGLQGSSNIKLLSHIPMGGPFYSNDVEVEQELSRPYVYVSGRSHYGFKLVNIKDPAKAFEMYRWTIENDNLHTGRATAPAYLKTNGRYYYAQAFQFQQGGPDADLGAVIFDVTGLPDTSKIKEAVRLRAPDAPGGFHEIFAYKHSSGAALLLTTGGNPGARIYDIGKATTGDKGMGFIGRIPNPTTTEGAAAGYHDFYAGYDPVTKADRFFGAGSGGYYVYDITNLLDPKLLVSATGISGLSRGHTFTPTPDGRYAVLESEYQYAPLRIIDLKPGFDGTVKNISRPIGAWTNRWQGLPHNHEVRWPYVFVSTYEDGMSVFNMMDPTNPYTVGYYDTYDGPVMLNKDKPFDVPTPGQGSVANGADGIDVRNADGLIVIGDLYTGLWLFKMEGFDGWNGHQWGMPNQSSAQDWDNGPDGAPKPQKVS